MSKKYQFEDGDAYVKALREKRVVKIYFDKHRNLTKLYEKAEELYNGWTVAVEDNEKPLAFVKLWTFLNFSMKLKEIAEWNSPQWKKKKSRMTAKIGRSVDYLENLQRNLVEKYNNDKEQFQLNQKLKKEEEERKKAEEERRLNEEISLPILWEHVDTDQIRVEGKGVFGRGTDVIYRKDQWVVAKIYFDSNPPKLDVEHPIHGIRQTTFGYVVHSRPQPEESKKLTIPQPASAADLDFDGLDLPDPPKSNTNSVPISNWSSGQGTAMNEADRIYRAQVEEFKRNTELSLDDHLELSAPAPNAKFPSTGNLNVSNTNTPNQIPNLIQPYPTQQDIDFLTPADEEKMNQVNRYQKTKPLAQNVGNYSGNVAVGPPPMMNVTPNPYGQPMTSYHPNVNSQFTVTPSPYNQFNPIQPSFNGPSLTTNMQRNTSSGTGGQLLFPVNTSAETENKQPSGVLAPVNAALNAAKAGVGFKPSAVTPLKPVAYPNLYPKKDKVDLPEPAEAKSKKVTFSDSTKKEDGKKAAISKPKPKPKVAPKITPKGDPTDSGFIRIVGSRKAQFDFSGGSNACMCCSLMFLKVAFKIPKLTNINTRSGELRNLLEAIIQEGVNKHKEIAKAKRLPRDRNRALDEVREDFNDGTMTIEKGVFGEVGQKCTKSGTGFFDVIPYYGTKSGPLTGFHLIVNGSAYSWFCNARGTIVYFDSHRKDPKTGRPGMSGGGCLIWFKNFYALTNYLYNLHGGRPRNAYEICIAVKSKLSNVV